MVNKEKFNLNQAFGASEANGRERNPCEYCGNNFKKGDKIVKTISSTYRGILTYSRRYCYKCFLKALLFNFKELMFDKGFIEKTKREFIMENIDG
jgi:hypothetical protein